MKNIVRQILGLNLIALVYLARAKPRSFTTACLRAFFAARRWPAPEPQRPAEIPEIALDKILGDRTAQIRLSVSQYEDGMLPSNQLMALLAILVAEAPDVVLEIGTFMGHTTRHIAENLDHATVHTLDLPPDFVPEAAIEDGPPKDDFHLIKKRRVGRDYLDRPCAARITQHFGDSAQWNFSAARGATCFFIDGSHTYEYCKSDSEQCYALCRGRGVFLWHDCDDTHPGVQQFVREWRAMGRAICRIAGTPIAYWSTITETE